MDPGRRDQLVELLEPTPTTGAGGEVTTTYAVKATAWAEIVPDKRGTEAIRAQKPEQRLRYTATLEHDPSVGLAVGWRLRWQGKDFDIVDLPTVSGRPLERWLTIEERL